MSGLGSKIINNSTALQERDVMTLSLFTAKNDPVLPFRSYAASKHLELTILYTFTPYLL